MPTEPDEVWVYADILRRDAKAYFIDVERHFRCQEQERREVFEQARLASEDDARISELQDRVRQ